MRGGKGKRAARPRGAPAGAACGLVPSICRWRRFLGEVLERCPRERGAALGPQAATPRRLRTRGPGLVRARRARSDARMPRPHELRAEALAYVVRAQLEPLVDPGYRAYLVRLVPTDQEILGVRVPVVRGAARAFAK